MAAGHGRGFSSVLRVVRPERVSTRKHASDFQPNYVFDIVRAERHEVHYTVTHNHSKGRVNGQATSPVAELVRWHHAGTKSRRRRFTDGALWAFTSLFVSLCA